MKLAVFGSTGGTGRQIVAQALDAGHEVTAFTRHSTALTARRGLTIAAGSTHDRASVARAVAGQPEPGEPATLAEAAWTAEHDARADPSLLRWQRAADAWSVLGLSEARARCLDLAGRKDEAAYVRRRLRS